MPAGSSLSQIAERVFATDADALIAVAVTSVLTYLVTLAAVRLLVGLRSLAKISATDFAITIALGTILAITALSGTISFPVGAVGLLTFFAVKWAVGVLRARAGWPASCARPTCAPASR